MTSRPRDANDDDREDDRVGYELRKHGDAVATHADQLRRWAYQGHRDGRDHLWMADKAGIQLSDLEALIDRAEAIERSLSGYDPEAGMDARRAEFAAKLEGIGIKTSGSATT